MNKTYKETGEIELYSLPEYNINKWGNCKNYNPEFLIIDSNNEYDSFNFKIEFSGNVGLIYNDKISFSIKILSREGNYFYKEIYSKEDIRKSSMDLNIYNLSINSNKLRNDNEYILKLTYNLIKDDNTIEPIIENTSKFIDGMVDENNDYLVVLKGVDFPILSIGSFSTPSISGLKTKSIITDKKIRSVSLDFDFVGAIIVSIDGVSMSEFYDYERKDKLIVFNDTLPKDTVITISGFSKDDSINGFVAETYLVGSNSKTPNKTNVKDGVFYDKNSNKFGVAMKKGIATTSEPILILNGQQLLLNSDFYVDVNDNSMIYLNGLLLEDDIVSIYYIPEFVSNEIFDNKILLNITLDNPIHNEEGFFDLKISNTKNFDEFESIKIDYIDGQGVYVFDVEYMSKGLKYLKVDNIKTYELINSKEIKISKESKIIKLIFK